MLNHSIQYIPDIICRLYVKPLFISLPNHQKITSKADDIIQHLKVSDRPYSFMVCG